MLTASPRHIQVIKSYGAKAKLAHLSQQQWNRRPPTATCRTGSDGMETLLPRPRRRPCRCGRGRAAALRHPATREQAATQIRDTVLGHPWFRAVCVAGRPVGQVSVWPYADEGGHRAC